MRASREGMRESQNKAKIGNIQKIERWIQNSTMRSLGMRSPERCSTSEALCTLWVLTVQGGGSGDPPGVGIWDLRRDKGKE